MRRFVFVILVSSLLLTLVFVQKGNIPAVKASSSIYQGDLILTGNNVTTIEDRRFDINGSIIVEDNATLHLKNAFLNLTQTDRFQYNITLRNPSNGNPRLLAFNSTITSTEYMYIHLFDNSTTTIDNSTISNMDFLPTDNSYLSILSGSNLLGLEASGSSVVSTYYSSHYSISIRDSSEVYASDSESLYVHIRAQSVNCTISNLEPGLITYWSFITNCSVNIPTGGYAPNVTFADTNVDIGWGFHFSGSSNVSFEKSTITQATGLGNSIISLKSTRCQHVDAFYDSVFLIDNSDTNTINAIHSSNSWLLNSTYNYLKVYDSAKIYVGWYLDVHVIDSIAQDVPSANVTATYPNATVAEWRLTDANGWTRLTLIEKMINFTGSYPIGNYTVSAKYETHEGQQSVNMTDNQEIIIQLPFIIPEFPSFLILLLFMTATLLAVIAYRRQLKKGNLVKKEENF